MCIVLSYHPASASAYTYRARAQKLGISLACNSNPACIILPSSFVMVIWTNLNSMENAPRALCFEDFESLMVALNPNLNYPTLWVHLSSLADQSRSPPKRKSQTTNNNWVGEWLVCMAPCWCTQCGELSHLSNLGVTPYTAILPLLLHQENSRVRQVLPKVTRHIIITALS